VSRDRHFYEAKGHELLRIIPKRKFIHQMIYGIQASKDVKLSSIARTLDEDIPLIKTETRLSRQINSRDLISTIGKHLIEEGKPFIKEDTVLALDLSDISKKYSEKQVGFKSENLEILNAIDEVINSMGKYLVHRI